MEWIWELDMKASDIIVVGAGISGLSAALQLSKSHPTTIVDRLPIYGGLNAGYENKIAKSLDHRCRQSGVRLIYGTTALRWSSDRGLLVVGPAGIEWLPGRHLIIASGIRPSVSGELGILGDRVSGIFPGMVAHHLLETGVRLGNRVVLLGGGDWAMKTGKLMAKQGCKIKMLPFNETMKRPDFADEWWPSWTPISVNGKGRIAEVILEREGLQERLLCDAFVLTAKMKPVRNIEGAIFDVTSREVSFFQLVSATITLDERSAYAEKCANQLLSELG
jgi:thioredoxin reductase